MSVVCLGWTLYLGVNFLDSDPTWDWTVNTWGGPWLENIARDLPV